ncbi:LOW QUALITY PROTEIN: photoreceptor ankyrin repeat protein [Pluvialis apricaria]
MTDACGGGEHADSPASRLDASDPELHYEGGGRGGGVWSPQTPAAIFSDDSDYPCYEPSLSAGGAGDLSLYQCCARNDAKLGAGRSWSTGGPRSEATELDINGRNGLMVACYKGFVDIVPLLQKCPYININQQDKDGNTALMMAAQAGHITIVNYLLNYYPGLKVDQRDPRGLTALMKAAVQGRQDCVAALLLAGADLQAVDPVKGKTAREWAVFTGRFEDNRANRSLLQRPTGRSSSGTQYRPEWPALAELVAKALAPKTRVKRLSEKIRSMITFNFPPMTPEVDGVMALHGVGDTSLCQPFVATACQTVCPNSPPEVGKHRLTVPDDPRAALPDSEAEPECTSCPGTGASSCNGQAMSEIRLLPPRRPAGCLLSFLPLRLRCGNSISPRRALYPKINVSTKPPAHLARSKEVDGLAQGGQGNLLQPPKWRYRSLKEEKRAAKEAESEEKKKKRGKRC